MVEQRLEETGGCVDGTRSRSLEQLLIGISTRMINLPVEQADAVILEALGEISAFVGADRAHLLSPSPDGSAFSITHEWCAPGIETKRQVFQNVPATRFPWTAEKILRGEAVVINSPADYPPHAVEEMAAARALGGQSFVLVPMHLRGSVVGIVGFVAARGERRWDEGAISILKLVGNTFANAIEHQRESRELAERQSRIEAIFRSADQVGFIMVKAYPNDMRILEFSPGAEKMLGWNASEAVGRSLGDLACSTAGDLMRRHIEGILSGGDGAREETAMTRRNGKQFPVLLVTSPVREQDGGVRAALAVCMDLTVQRGQKELMAVLLDGSLDPALLVDRDGRIMAVNAVVAQRLGRTQGELVGVPLETIFPQEVAVARLEIVRRAIETGLPVRYQDGHFGRHFDSLVTPVRGPDGSIEAVAVYSRDVTYHHQVEQEILNASTRERQRFGRELHDRLGQQLTGIRFMAAALVDKARGSDQSLAADVARIEELLTEAAEQVRRISRGVAPVGMDDEDLQVALRQLATDTEEVFRIPCTTRFDVRVGAEVNGTVATELYWIASEAVSNAMKHGSPSQVEILLQVTGENGLLSVHDNGGGLPEKWEGRGGMGIRIMRYRASVIGAKIEIESIRGEGTTVSCEFSTRLTAGQSMPGGNPMPVR